MQNEYPIVVFSHLRWDFVLQRPQHLLTRLAARHPVIFIEEPVYDANGTSWERSRPAPGVLVCRPHTAVRTPGFNDEQLAVLAPLVTELLKTEGAGTAVAWVYTPMALPLARAIVPDAIVYDCMDELSLFLGAPAGLLEREQELIDSADVMFTGGPSLYEAKRTRHPNVHCFPSSVDAAHFHQALTPGLIPEPVDQAHLPRPRLGYYGVIDERLDLAIVDRLATSHPEWSIVIVGPVVKIDPASLPRHANILYTGQRSYAELPAYLAGWDICLLPFALNDATRFISPTKTLEYMVAERPIVSTPITDVARPYGDIVYIAATPGDFVRACETALASPPAERQRRAALMQGVLSRTSWDATAAAMDRLIARALAARTGASA